MGRLLGKRMSVAGGSFSLLAFSYLSGSVILSEAKELCAAGQLQRSFAAKNAAQDDNS